MSLEAGGEMRNSSLRWAVYNFLRELISRLILVPEAVLVNEKIKFDRQVKYL